jgi:tetratricopeptide (TPR) repeat protein
MSGSRSARGQRGVATALILWLAFGASLAVWVVAQRTVDYRRDTWPAAYPLLFLPSGQYLKASSLGFSVLLADVIYLWSIQYYGYHRTEEGRNYLWHIYDVITDLDPHFIDAYLLGALIMANDMNDANLAIELLEKGIEHNAQDWILSLDAGFYAYSNLEDPVRAAAFFDRASAVPGAPPQIARLHAHMYEQAGDLVRSLQFWVDIYEGTDDERVESIAWQHIYDLRVTLDLQLLGAAVERFQTEHGNPPSSLQDLVDAGFLRGMPQNPNGNRYVYNPVTGQVTDPEAGQRRAAQ